MQSMNMQKSNEKYS